MTVPRFDSTSRRALLGCLPAALLGLCASALVGAGPARAKSSTSAANASYDPLKQVWICTFNECDPYYYHPEKGDPVNIVGGHPIPPDTAFEDLPDDWRCPICGAGKDWFEKHA
jgi:rubredoxin